MKPWIRHPLLRALQAVIVLIAALLGVTVHSSAHPRVAGTEFALSVWGEFQDRDGTWRGVDLLAHPEAGADRFQVAVTPVTQSRVVVVQLGPGAERQLFPAAGESGVLAGGRTWPLPGVLAFYPREGGVQLRVTVSPVDDERVDDAVAFGSTGVEAMTLPDGKPQVVSSRLFRAEHGGRVELKR